MVLIIAMCVINATALSRLATRRAKRKVSAAGCKVQRTKIIFRGPENRQRVKDWRKGNPGYWRKKNSSSQAPLQEVFQSQAAQNEQVSSKQQGIALQDLFSMQHAVIVGLISMMAGGTLQDDIVATAQELRRKGEDVLGGNVTFNF